MNFPRIIGSAGLVTIIILCILYIREQSNSEPLFMGETQQTIGYVIENKISPSGKGAVHEIVYEYIFEQQSYTDSYYSNKSISRLNPGDSLTLEVSISTPSKNKVTGYFRMEKYRCLTDADRAYVSR